MKRPDIYKAKSNIAGPNTIRRINRQIVLNIIRQRSPISRAEIARETNLQRSTVSAIVTSLESSQLIEDIGTGDSTGGRKPNLLRLKTKVPAAIGIDISPTTSTVALADLAGKVLSETEFETSPDSEETLQAVIAGINEVTVGIEEDLPEVGISIPGVTSLSESRVKYVPYFDWRDWPIVSRIKKETGLTSQVDNDANAMALAELWFGLGLTNDTNNFISVHVGEGIGTGVVFEGRVYRGASGDAGEFGHMIIGSGAPVDCSCGSRDCWEAFASNGAAIERFGRDDVFEAARNGDDRAISALKETARFLGIGISNLITGLGPRSVVVNGEISTVWEEVEDTIYETVEKGIRRKLSKTMIAPSTLSTKPALTGALTLILSRVFAESD